MKNINEEHSKYGKLLSFTQGETSPTNKELVEDMISQLERLDDSVLKNPNNTFLDSCAGTGTFGVVLYNKLSQYHTHEWIMKNMIFMVDKSQVNCDILKRLGFVNVYKKDFLNEELNMKFDVIVGNPPYQHPTNKRWKLWVTFLEKNLELVNKNGFVAMVNPTAWVSGIGKELERARSIIKNNNMMVFNNNVNHYFNGIGENIGFNIIQKTDYKGKTFLTNTGNNIDFWNRELSIFEKITNKVLVDDDNISLRNYLSAKNPDLETNRCSLNRSDIYNVKVVHTGSKNLFYQNTETFTKFLGWKVIINMSGNYYQENKNYIYVSYEDIPGRNVVGVFTNTENEAKKVKFVLTSKLFRFVVDNNKTSGFNSPVSKFPRLTQEILSLTTEDEIYEYFGITQEEIEFIQNNVN
jgi:16S rRNA G966 N2-methylase RsmD